MKVPATTLRRWTRGIGEEVQRFEREVVEEGKPGADRVYIAADGTGVPMRRSETQGGEGQAGGWLGPDTRGEGDRHLHRRGHAPEDRRADEG